MEIEGIVIKNSHYRDNDAMLTVLTSKGLVSFLAKGVYKINSKNARAVSLYSISKFELIEGHNGLLLKTGVCQFSLFKAFNSLNSLTALSFIGEITFKGLSEDDNGQVYDYLADAIKSIENDKNPFIIAIEYLILLLKNVGYALDVDECVMCLSKDHNYIDIDYISGGVVCDQCCKSEPKKSNEYVDALIMLCHIKDIDDTLWIDNQTLKELYFDLAVYYKDSLGADINSYPMLMSLLV